MANPAVQDERIIFRLLDTIDQLLAALVSNLPLAILARIETNVEHLMTQSDRLDASISALATGIGSEMADLAAAIAAAGANNPAIDASIARIDALVAQLATDDAAPTPPTP